jgi:outer membrane protein TolC
MMCPPYRSIVVVFILIGFGLGCRPTKPIYLRDSGDLNYYLEQATEISYPDVQTQVLDEVTQSYGPITVREPNFDSLWDLPLEDAISIALQNTKLIRGYGTPGLIGARVSPGVDDLSNNPDNAGSVFSVAMRETEPGFLGIPGQLNNPGAIPSTTQLNSSVGVEAALSEFDAQITTGLFWQKTDRPQNFIQFNPNDPAGALFTPVQNVDTVTYQSQIAKKTAVGTQLLARNITTYNSDHNPAGIQALNNWYQTAWEMEIRQPLARGRGTFINRLPVVIARINTDIEIANLESQVQNFLTNVEIRYWDLYCAYRNYEAAKTGRDSALKTWHIIKDKFKEGTVAAGDEAESRQQVAQFDGQVKRAWSELLDAEGNLRYLMGIAIADGRLIRPIDEPLTAELEFEWCESLDEALSYRPELRQKRWDIKKAELQLAGAKNSLLPIVNATALYRFLGLGEDLVQYDDNVLPFPNPGSGAVNQLYDGNFQEFQVGLDFAMSVGLRKELSNVRRAQVNLSLEKARLEDQELDISRQLSFAHRALDTNYQLAESAFQEWAAASVATDAAAQLYQAGSESIDRLLDSQRRQSQAEINYHQFICEYNKVLAIIHRRKGTTLSYCNVCFNEGPWPGKAYDDARENARRRSSSRPMNYGWTRPGVVSLNGHYPGADEIYQGGEMMTPDYMAPGEIEGEIIEGDIIFEGPMEELGNPMLNQSQPTTQSKTNSIPVAMQPGNQKVQVVARSNEPLVLQAEQTIRDDSVRQASATENTATQLMSSQQTTRQPENTQSSIDWEKFGMKRPVNNDGTQNKATIK